MRVSEIRVKQIRVNQGLGVYFLNLLWEFGSLWKVKHRVVPITPRSPKEGRMKDKMTSFAHLSLSYLVGKVTPIFGAFAWPFQPCLGADDIEIVNAMSKEAKKAKQKLPIPEI